jgi:hypothetical protein
MLYDPTSKVVEYLNPTKAAKQSVTKFVTSTEVKFVKPKAAAKGELLFNKPATN